MNPYKILIARQQKTIEELKAELTYWEETAINWRDKYEEAKLELQDQKETAKYWQDQYEEVESEVDYWQSYY